MFRIRLQFKKKLVSLVTVAVVFILPSLANGQEVGPPRASSGLVPCGNSYGQPACDFTQFIIMVNGIINWIIGIATVIFAVSLIYGGFLYMTSGENPGNKTKATGILWNTLKGFVIILVAWLIIYTILSFLVVDPGTNTIFQFIGRS